MEAEGGNNLAGMGAAEARDLLLCAGFPVSNPMPLLNVSAAGRISYANPAAGALLESWGTAVGGEVPAEITAVLNLALEGRRVEHFDHQAGGAEYWAYVVPLPNGSANFYCLEVTERNRALASLREREARLSAIVENATEGIIVIDGTGIIEAFNPAAERVFGYTAAELLGRNVSLLMEEPQAGRHDEYLKRCREEGTTQAHRHGRELSGRRKDGSRVPLDLAVVEMQVAGELRFLGMVGDLTERKEIETRQRQLEEQMQQAQKLESLGLLAGGIAHDFNNLLVGVLGNVGLALQDLPRESPVRPILQDVETAALRAADLTRQMLAYSGRGRFVVENISLTRVVEEMAHLLQTVISRKAVLRFDFASDTPLIRADATQIRQVVMNLITNASDAIGQRSGFITIRTGMLYADQEYLESTYLKNIPQPGYYTFLEVNDTGMGMSAETQLKVFDPFFSTKFTGRGLGLAAVLGIVRSHGGTIKLYSEPGRGTTFKVLLPCDDAQAPAGDHLPPQPAPEVPLTGRVLLAEDDESVAAVARAILTRAGMEVSIEPDGGAALEAFYRDPAAFDLVIADLTMPHLGGDEVFRRLRLTHPEVPVVLVSGYSEHEVSPSFAGKGLAGFVQKPFKPAELLQAVSAALSRGA